MFWNFVNMMFNKPDPERIKTLGPDRACAEWVLRNGGKIVWADGKKTVDYISLPSEEKSVPKVLEIDASDSGISHYGFPHLAGCIKLHKIILHNNSYIDDQALQGLSYGKSTLSHVQVSNCYNITDPGLKEIKALNNLETLVLFDLSGVKNLEECKKYLQTHLPKCKIEGMFTSQQVAFGRNAFGDCNILPRTLYKTYKAYNHKVLITVSGAATNINEKSQ